MGVNNLPRVAARQCPGRELNPRPIDRESNALATTLLSHRYITTKVMGATILNFWRLLEHNLAVGPGNAQFVSIHQVCWRRTYRCYSVAADAAAIRQFTD